MCREDRGLGQAQNLGVRRNSICEMKICPGQCKQTESAEKDGIVTNAMLYYELHT